MYNLIYANVKKKKRKRKNEGWVWWYLTVIPATHKGEVGDFLVQDQPGKQSKTWSPEKE
jgi:hypothetical protein